MLNSGPQGTEFDTTSLDLAFFLILLPSVSSLSVIFSRSYYQFTLLSKSCGSHSMHAMLIFTSHAQYV